MVVGVRIHRRGTARVHAVGYEREESQTAPGFGAELLLWGGGGGGEAMVGKI